MPGHTVLPPEAHTPLTITKTHIRFSEHNAGLLEELSTEPSEAKYFPGIRNDQEAQYRCPQTACFDIPVRQISLYTSFRFALGLNLFL